MAAATIKGRSRILQISQVGFYFPQRGCYLVDTPSVFGEENEPRVRKTPKPHETGALSVKPTRLSVCNLEITAPRNEAVSHYPASKLKPFSAVTTGRNSQPSLAYLPR